MGLNPKQLTCCHDSNFENSVSANQTDISIPYTSKTSQCLINGNVLEFSNVLDGVKVTVNTVLDNVLSTLNGVFHLILITTL